MKNALLTARVTALRITHGTHHMPGPALLMRVAITLFGTGVTLTTEGWLGVFAGAMTVVSGVVTLWELRDAALDCEADFDEDQGDEFGTAA